MPERRLIDGKWWQEVKGEDEKVQPRCLDCLFWDRMQAAPLLASEALDHLGRCCLNPQVVAVAARLTAYGRDWCGSFLHRDQAVSHGWKHPDDWE